MSKVIVCIFGCLLFLSCSSDNENPNSPLAGQHYLITSYRLDTPMDFNGDGQFSNDLLIETPLFSSLWFDVFNDCLSSESLRFEEQGIACPFGGGLFLEVMEDDNGDLIQNSLCAVLSCEEFTTYSINDDQIVFSFGNGLVKEGVFLNDTITIIFSENEIQSHEFLQNDGTIVTYSGSVTIEYTLE